MKKIGLLVFLAWSPVASAEDAPKPALRLSFELIALPLDDLHQLVIAPRPNGADGLRARCRKLVEEKRALIVATPVLTTNPGSKATMKNDFEIAHPARLEIRASPAPEKPAAAREDTFLETFAVMHCGISVDAEVDFAADSGLMASQIVLDISPPESAQLAAGTKLPPRAQRSTIKTFVAQPEGAWIALGTFTPIQAGQQASPWRGLCFYKVERADGAVPKAPPQSQPALEMVLEAIELPQAQWTELLDKFGPAKCAEMRAETLAAVAAKKAALFDSVVLASSGRGASRVFSGVEFHYLERQEIDRRELQEMEMKHREQFPNVPFLPPPQEVLDQTIELGWTLECDVRTDDDRMTNRVKARWAGLVEKAATAAPADGPPRVVEHTVETSLNGALGLPTLLGACALPEREGRLHAPDHRLLLFLTTTRR